MLSYSWAMSLFWTKQMANTFIPTGQNPMEKVAAGFEPVTRATVGQLDGALGAAFKAGDNLQRGMVDLMFSMMNPASWDPNRMMKMSADAMQQSAKAAQQAAQGAARATCD